MKKFVENVKMIKAAPGIEPGFKDLQSVALPLGYTAMVNRVEGENSQK